MPKTYNDLYLDARRQLKHSGVEAASLEARELLCYAAGKDRDSFFRDMRLYVTDEVELRMQELLQRRIDGEPAAYLIGEWEFYGLPLDITRSVLIPRSDTEVIAQRAIELAKAAGEGCRVLADINEDALHIARTNARRNGLTRQVMCMKADALQPPAAMLGCFDIIVSNPPYIPTGDLAGLDHSVRDYEPVIALDGGEDGLDFYRAISSLWKSALKSGGTLLFEVGFDQADAVEQLLAAEGYHDIDSRMDTQNIWRAVEGKL